MIGVVCREKKEWAFRVVAWASLSRVGKQTDLWCNEATLWRVQDDYHDDDIDRFQNRNKFWNHAGMIAIFNWPTFEGAVESLQTRWGFDKNESPVESRGTRLSFGGLCAIIHWRIDLGLYSGWLNSRWVSEPFTRESFLLACVMARQLIKLVSLIQKPFSFYSYYSTTRQGDGHFTTTERRSPKWSFNHEESRSHGLIVIDTQSCLSLIVIDEWKKRRRSSQVIGRDLRNYHTSVVDPVKSCMIQGH